MYHESYSNKLIHTYVQLPNYLFLRFVELLLSRHAAPDVRNKKGNSSLWLSANGGHLDVVQLLYSAGADIDSQDNRKVSCLMAAFRKGHLKVKRHFCHF